MSVIDMLMDIGNFGSQLTAVLCFERELSSFAVPTIRRGSHLKNPDALDVPPALKEPLALLIRSGVWATLSVPVQRLIPVFLALTDWDDGNLEGTLRLSNRAMMRYSAIGTFTSISQALTELERIGWVTRLESTRRGNSQIEDTAGYRITPLSDAVKELAISTSPTFGEAIKAEKAIRKRKREERSRVLQSQRQTRFG
jgi:DNA-binding HxlR family transcriptional regulator